MPLKGRGWLWLAGAALAVALAGLVWHVAGAGWWADVISAVQSAQRTLHGRLAQAMRAVQSNQALAMWNLVTLGFLYGVFHAAGPGHGKVVIATYLATTESGARRGIALTLASSFAQGLTAILVVEVTVRLLGLALRDARTGASAVETASYALLALVGAGLAVSALRRSWRRFNMSAVAAGPSSAAGADNHGRDHAHGPDAASLEAPMKVSHALAIVCSVGLRPCSGAVLVLLFSKVLGLTAAGIVAVLAISAGTALTVSALALMAVHMRRAALYLSRRGGATSSGLAAGLDLAALIGGLIIVIIGISLLSASLDQVRHPLV